MVQHITRNVRPKDYEPPKSDVLASKNLVDKSLIVKDFILSELRSKNYEHNFYRDFEMADVDGFVKSEESASKNNGKFETAADS
jgi:hypothetical protein